MDSSPNLQLPYLIAAQAQKHVTHNEALRTLDAVVQLFVLDKDLAGPPGSPSDGSRYIIAASPTGAWSGQAGKIAAWQDGAWMFYVPREGWLAWVADEDKLYVYSGTAWGEFTSPGTGAPLWGINTTADTTNRLAVRSPASLLDNVGNGHQQKINKAAAGDTASTLYQTGNSGRAEYGLTGDDDFHIKVSPDGSVWKEALVVDRATAAMRAPTVPPIVILATGQSNFVQAPALSWVPAPNAKIWNNTVDSDGSVGTAFVALDATKMNAAAKFASEVAHANPLRTVYLVNVSFSGRAIAGWKTGASAPDVYDNIADNIAPALTAAGVTKISALLWWQGEADRSAPSGYVADFATVVARFRAETWFPAATPITVFGIASTAICGDAAYGNFNVHQQRTVLAEPDLRQFVYTAALPAGLWNPPAHMTAAGYEQAGQMAADAYLGRHRRAQHPGVTHDAESGFLGFGIGAVPPAAPFEFSRNAASLPAPVAGTVGRFVQADGVIHRLAIEAYGNANSMTFRRANGTGASPSALLANDIIFNFVSFGYGATGFSAGSRGGLAMFAAENWTDTEQGTYTGFFTCPIGTASLVEQARLLGNGFLGVKTTAPSNPLSVEGIAAPQSDNAYTLGTAAKRWSEVYAATGTINTSDARLKTDVADSPLGLGFILSLRPRAFRWLDGGTDVAFDDEPIEEEVPLTEARTVTTSVLELRDGVAVERPIERRVQVPVVDWVPVVDAAGAPVLADGVPKLHAVPRMTKAVVEVRKSKRETVRAGKRTHHGLLAQEVRAALTAAGADDFAGWVLADQADPGSLQGLRYDQFIAPLIRSVQELAARVAALEQARRP